MKQARPGNMISSFQETPRKALCFSTCDKGFRQDVSRKAAQHAHDTKSQDVPKNGERRSFFFISFLFPFIIEPKETFGKAIYKLRRLSKVAS